MTWQAKAAVPVNPRFTKEDARRLLEEAARKGWSLAQLEAVARERWPGIWAESLFKMDD